LRIDDREDGGSGGLRGMLSEYGLILARYQWVFFVLERAERIKIRKYLLEKPKVCGELVV
jgi:hypothetical protein